MSVLQNARCAIDRLDSLFKDDRAAFAFSDGFRVLRRTMIKLIQVKSDEDVESVQQLFREYSAWLGVNLCFQNFDKELAQLPGEYVPPSGRLLLAVDDEQVAGCVALRRIGEKTGEMKRLYVRPEFRGKGLGRTLTEAIIEAASAIGYKRLRLDTISHKMKKAILLYHSLGFNQIEPYYDNPLEGVLHLEFKL